MNSPITQLLVHVDNSDRSAQRLAVARQLALSHGAALAALHAVTPSFVALPQIPAVGPDFAATMQAIDDEKRHRARQVFDAAMAGLKDPRQANWCEIKEPPVIGAFVEQALYADLLVLGQHDPADAASTDVPADFAPSVLAASGKPALVVPFATVPRSPPGGRHGNRGACRAPAPGKYRCPGGAAAAR